MKKVGVLRNRRLAALRATPTPAGFVALAVYPASGRTLQHLVGTLLRR
jgi:hypothetical protein